MVDCIKSVFEFLTGCCGLCAKWKDSMDKLEEDLNSLKKASGELNDRYLDVKMKVETTEQDPNSSLVILNEVRGWMRRVEVLQNEVDTILKQGDEETQDCFFGGRCPTNFRACSKLHKMVTQKLSAVNDEKSKGNFHVVAEMFAHNRFVELLGDKAVGVESTFEELCSCFEDKQVGIIGLYGMGGVGKSTLLQKFNNDFLSTKPHYVVIWVVATKDVDEEKIQDGIRNKFGVKDDIWKNKTKDERARLLYNILNKKKFVLLFDDVWTRIDLLKLGVPSPKNHKHECKIIFTTRSYDVCCQMRAVRRIRVNCLISQKAFELFEEKVGKTTLENHLIFDLAEKVVNECQGLPLALCTVGNVMANKEIPHQWKHVLEILRTYPSQVQDMVEKVYLLLQFSYDRLADSDKLCFLYCALFPEDYNISEEDIILLWIAEGFLAEFKDDIHKARQRGEDIISNLKSACLLEDGEEYDRIKMHDVIRDVALWIACDHDESSRFFVRDCSNTRGLDHAQLREVEKLSMWRGDGTITDLSQKPHCPDLVTLLVRETKIQVFPTEVFVISRTTRVLDLSDNFEITDLPSEIGDFGNLEYLNLSNTGLRKLPEELKKLTGLRFLLLNNVKNLEIPKDVISSLLSLRAFSLISYEVIDDDNDALLQELEGLDHLQDIRITVRNRSSVEKILNSSKLQGRVSKLFVVECSLHLDSISSLWKMEHLETLGIRSVNFDVVNILRSSLLEHELTSLRMLILRECGDIADLNWLIHAPYLEYLELFGCRSLEKVISEDFGTAANTEGVKINVFSSLTYLQLDSLSKLERICSMTVQFPCLKKIAVTNCPRLKELPFNSGSILKNLRRFEGEDGCMDKLRWEDEPTKDLFSSKFVRIRL